MQAIRKVIFLIGGFLVILAGCLPQHQVQTHSFTEIGTVREELVTILPVRTNLMAPAVDLTSQEVRYEFDLSSLPPQIHVAKAVLKMYALSKAVMTRILSLAETGELSPHIFATAFLESDVPFMNTQAVPCRNSAVQWSKADGMTSVMTATGGTGGRVPYFTLTGGWEEWDVTPIVVIALKTGTSSISLRNTLQKLEFRDGTILSTTVIQGAMKYAGLQDEVRRPQLVITFRYKGE